MRQTHSWCTSSRYHFQRMFLAVTPDERRGRAEAAARTPARVPIRSPWSGRHT